MAKTSTRGVLTVLFITSAFFFSAIHDLANAADRSLTAAQAEQTLWDQVLPERLTYIQDGHGGPIIYDFQDPNCPYCHLLYENEVPLIRAGKLTVRYVPVAILTPQSPGEAAAWLLSPHPLATLQHFETLVGPVLRTGDYDQLPHQALTPKISKELQVNKAMFFRLGFDGTPALLFRDKDGELGRVPGLISTKQLRKLLPELEQ